MAEITELWVENSQKINYPDITSIREGRVLIYSIYTKSPKSDLRPPRIKNTGYTNAKTPTTSTKM